MLQVENNAIEDVPALSLFFLDYSEEGHDEDEEMLEEQDPYEGDEDSIRTRHKHNSVATISRLRVQPFSSSRFHIPLCRLLAMPMVRAYSSF
jgi:hypothetical protein